MFFITGAILNTEIIVAWQVTVRKGVVKKIEYKIPRREVF